MKCTLDVWYEGAGGWYIVVFMHVSTTDFAMDAPMRLLCNRFK
jgi:hypothetical protein